MSMKKFLTISAFVVFGFMFASSANAQIYPGGGVYINAVFISIMVMGLLLVVTVAVMVAMGLFKTLFKLITQFKALL